MSKDRPTIDSILKGLTSTVKTSNAVVGAKAQYEGESFSTGSLLLDRALGTKGVPLGRIIEVFGNYSSGKTTLCYLMMAQAQQVGIVPAFIDLEGWQRDWAESLGVDLSNMILSQPDSLEAAITEVKQLVISGSKFIVMDSLANAGTVSQLEGAAGDHHVGVKARIMASFLPAITPLLRKHQATLIVINQVREKIGCVHPEAEVEWRYQDGEAHQTSMEQMFLDLGYNYTTMKSNEFVDVSSHGAEIKSYDTETGAIVWSEISKLVRKPNAEEFRVLVDGEYAFSCSHDHKIAVVSPEMTVKDVMFVSAEEIAEQGEPVLVLLDNHEVARAEVVQGLGTIPILDMEVKGTHTYFSNGVLSHNTMYGNPETTPGGRALGFACVQRWKIHSRPIREGQDVVGSEIDVSIVKNKLAAPFKKATLHLYFDRGFDIERETVQLAVTLGIINRRGAWYYPEFLAELGHPDVKAMGETNLIESITSVDGGIELLSKLVAEFDEEGASADEMSGDAEEGSHEDTEGED